MQRQQHVHLKRNGKRQRPHHQLRPGAGPRCERVDDGHAQPMLHHGTDGHGTGRLQTQLALHTGFGKNGINLRAVRIVARQTDKRFALKVLRRELHFLRQRVAGWQHGHLIHGGQRLAARAGRGIGQFRQAQIKALRRHPFLQQRCFLRGHADKHFAMAGMQPRQCARQQGVAECRQAQHADARTLRAAQLDSAVNHPLKPLPAALHLIPQQQGPRIGSQAALHPFKQGITQQLLHARQFATDGGLRGVEQLRRAGDAARRHDGAKHLDMPVRDAQRRI